MTQQYQELIKQISITSTSALAALLDRALGHASLVLNQQHRHTGADARLAASRSPVVKRFVREVEQKFERIVEVPGNSARRSFDLNNLSLMETSVQDAQVALQGMATHARNLHINELLRFTTRLNAQYYRARVDETNNPLDPGNLADAFNRAIIPLNLDAAALLDVYRQFNNHVFHHLEPVLQEVNGIIAASGTKPSLENLGRMRKDIANRRNGPRPTGDANTRAFSDVYHESEQDQTDKTMSKSPSLLETLFRQVRLHNLPRLRAITSATDSVTSSETRVLDRKQLLELLVNERKQENTARRAAAVDVPARVEALLKTASGTEQQLSLNRECADLVGLVGLLFEALETDPVVPTEPRALLRQTWTTMLQLTLGNPGFLDNGGHPFRTLLNEYAAACIGWSEHDRLEDDPLYRQARKAIEYLLDSPVADPTKLDALVEEFLAFKRQHLRKKAGSSSQLLSSSEGRQRLQELHDYARRRIAERLDGQTVPPQVRELLEDHYSLFLVKVLRRDGPGGDSWKPVMDTMDVLLWSVRPGKSAQDLERLTQINDRLMKNLANALKIAGLDQAQSGQLLDGIQRLQRADPAPQATRGAGIPVPPEPAPFSGEASASRVPPNDPAFRRCLETVKTLNIGAWLEFDVQDHEPVRCTLASAIPSIDWLIFVNRQGVKVVEKSRQGLAVELHRRSARLIDDGRLMDRAIETVLARLRSAD